MAFSDLTRRDAILARLAQSRAEIRELLEPASEAGEQRATPSDVDGQFPRSRTMRSILSGRGLGAAGAVLGGLLIARPALAWRLVRLLLMSAMARLLLVRAVSAMRSKHD